MRERLKMEGERKNERSRHSEKDEERGETRER